MTKKPHFIYQFTPKDHPELMTDPDAWTEDDSRISEEHFNYLKQGLADEVVIFAGRSLDGIGPAVVVLEVINEQAAREFMEADPFVKEGLFGADLHPFRAALVRVP